MKNNCFRLKSISGWFLFLLLIGFPATGFGREGNPREVPLPEDDVQVAALLAERPFEERVWVVYRIGAQKRRGLIPQLIDRLDLDRFPKYEAELALDALFKLEAFVPDDVLLKLLNDFPDKAAILLAFKPERHEKAILEMFERHAGAENKDDYLRLALAANLALKANTPGFAKALVARRLKLGKNLVVTDLMVRKKAEEEPRTPGGVLGCGCWPVCVPLRQEEIFPPVCQTVFSDWPLSKPFVDGPAHVVVTNLECPTEKAPSFTVGNFSRKEDASPVFRSVVSVGIVSSETFFDRYVSVLVGETVSLRKKETVIWKGRRAFARQVEKARTEGDANFRRIVNRLVERRFLTQSDADNFKPGFVVRILNPDDLRLPQLPGTVPAVGKERGKP